MTFLCLCSCTLEDAAIYQASASNSKGIVSCSGLLEVGEMNEFKIHERYFAKVKQKARRCKEAEGKENLEPLRTISPDHTLRKRRSSMESFLSLPSSTEDEGADEALGAVEDEKELEETLVSISNGEIDGQPIRENGTMSGTYTYDYAQKIFTEVMEIDRILTSSTVLNSRDVTENQNSTAVLASAEKPSKAVNVNGASVAPQKAHLTPKAVTRQTVTAAEGKAPACKPKEETSQMQKLVSAAAPKPGKAKRIEDVAARKTNDKPETTTGAAPELKAGSPQRGRAGDQLSEREVRPRLSEMRPALLTEVRGLLHMSSYVLCSANTGLLSSSIKSF